MKIKKITLILLLVIILIGCVYAIINPKGSNKKIVETDKITVVCTSFIGYDFTRTIVGDTDNISIIYLMDPGTDAHSFEPTVSQLIEMQNADLIIYNGGEMENWTEQVIPTLDLSKTKLLKIMNCVDLLEEETVDGAEEEHEAGEIDNLNWDEHVWTSPKNAMQIVKKVEEELENIDTENAEIFRTNSENYIEQIEKLDNDIWDIVNNAKRTKLIFGDRMPMRYFLEEFNLKASGAFNGCSTETEPSTRTLSYLIDTVRNENIPVVLYIENGNAKVANTIAEETGAKPMQIQTLHTISKDDFENGENYERNYIIFK